MSNVRPEAWRFYHDQDYKSPNELLLQKYSMSRGRLVKDKTGQDSWFSAKPI